VHSWNRPLRDELEVKLGRYWIDPATSSLQSMLPPPTALGGMVE
jgi:hypothetical protein